MSLEGLNQHQKNTLEGIAKCHKPGVLCPCAVTASTLVVGVVILIYFSLWRAWESARARKNPHRAAGSASLPSPVAALPRWLGLVGGHTMQINSEKVSDTRKLTERQDGRH